MVRKFSITVVLALLLAAFSTSLVFAADPTAQMYFTTDAPCAVLVQVLAYTDPAGVVGSTNQATSFTLNTKPSTSILFGYPTTATCNNITYQLLSIEAQPAANLTITGLDGSLTVITGHYSVPAPADTTPPVWTVPANSTAEATGPLGAIVMYPASAADPDDAVSSQSCSPASGSTFALGTTTVNCVATDTHGNTGTASFTVTVVDTSPPSLTSLNDITVDTSDSTGMVVSFTPSASDLVDGSVTVNCIPASGSLFPIGQTTVNCSAIDQHGNIGTGSFTVTVNLIVVDTVPPDLTLPTDMTVPAQDASGAVVNFPASAKDAVDGSVPVTCVPASGSTFPVGTTVVNCSASDSQGNTANGSFTVSVQYLADCKGVPGHQILQPINSDGSSVFKQGSTVPAKFRVCGTDGNAINDPDLITDFRLIQVIGDGAMPNTIDSTSAHDVFRSGAQQWIFDINTKNLSAGSTYVFLITLNDGSNIRFQFALK